MCFYVLAGYPCFQGGSDYLIFTKALALDYSFPMIVSELGKDFIRASLKFDANERPTIDELREHEFIRDAPDVFPIKTLAEYARESIRDHFINKDSEEYLDEQFPQILSKCPCIELEYLYMRLKYHFSKETTGHMNQGI